MNSSTLSGIIRIADMLWAVYSIVSVMLSTVVAVRNIRQALRGRDYDPISRWMGSVYPTLMWLAFPVAGLQMIALFPRLSLARVFMIGLLGLFVLLGLVAKRMESKA